MIKFPLYPFCHVSFAKRAVILTAGCGLLLALPSRAAVETWNAASGTWDTTTANWTGSTWSDGNGSDAVFGTGSAGTVTITPSSFGNGLGPTTDSIDFTQAGYTIGNATGNGTLTLGAGTNNAGQAGTVVYLGYTGTGTTTINSNLVQSSANSFLIGENSNGQGTANLVDNGTISGGSIALAFQADRGFFTLNGAISGSGTVKFNAFSAVLGGYTISGLNTFTGAVTLSGGLDVINTIGNIGTAQSLGEGTVANLGVINVQTANLELNLASDSSTNRELQLGKNFEVSSIGAGTVNFTSFADNLAGSGAVLTLNATNGSAADPNQFSGVMANDPTNPSTSTLAITQIGSGYWELTNMANTYTGPTTILGGTLIVTNLANGGSASSIGASSNAASNLIIHGGTLSYVGAAATTDRNFIIGSGGATIDASGTGAVNFSNTGTVSPDGAGITYTVANKSTTLTVSSTAGLAVGQVISGPGLPNGDIISSITNGTTVVLTTASNAAETSAQAGLVGYTARTLNLTGSNTGSNTIAGVLQDSANGAGAGPTALTVSKSGAGTWVLSNANSYSGGTTVAAGHLLVTNSTGSGTGSGAVSVTGSTAVLGGNGKISGAITLSSGGTLYSGAVASGTPTTGPGTGMTLTSALNVNGGALTFALSNSASGSSANPATSTTFLSLGSTGTISFTGTESINLVDLTSGGLTLRQGASYLLISAASDSMFSGLVTEGANGQLALDGDGTVLGVWQGGALTNYTAITLNEFSADGVTSLADATTADHGYYQPSLYLNNGDLEVVPEPGTWAMMIGGLAALVFWQRQRKFSRRD